MEIRPNQNSGPLIPVSGSRGSQRPARADAEDAAFSASDALTRALAEVPEKRVEVVQRAQKLLGDPTYPPRETIHQLSELLALRLPVE